MPNIADYRQANSDIALVQSGSAGVSRSRFVLGAKSGEPLLYNWTELRRLFAIASTDHVGWYDDFLGVIADPGPSYLQFDEGGTGTAAVASSALTLTTGALSGNHNTMCLGLHHDISNGFTIFDAKFNLGTITSVSAEVGLSDAVSETNGLAFSDHTLAGVTAVANDAVVVAFDAAGDANFNILSVNGGGTPQAFDVGSPPVAGTDVTVRIVVDSSGNADVYFNGALSQRVSSAVATTAVLTSWHTVVTATTAARTLVIDYFGVLSER